MRSCETLCRTSPGSPVRLSPVWQGPLVSHTLLCSARPSPDTCGADTAPYPSVEGNSASVGCFACPWTASLPGTAAGFPLKPPGFVCAGRRKAPAHLLWLRCERRCIWYRRIFQGSGCSGAPAGGQRERCGVG